MPRRDLWSCYNKKESCMNSMKWTFSITFCCKTTDGLDWLVMCVILIRFLLKFHTFLKTYLNGCCVYGIFTLSSFIILFFLILSHLIAKYTVYLFRPIYYKNRTHSTYMYNKQLIHVLLIGLLLQNFKDKKTKLLWIKTQTMHATVTLHGTTTFI